MIKAIIFDFDGVILESADIKTEAFRELFSENALKVDEIVEYHLANEGVSRYIKFRYIYDKILQKELPRQKEIELDERLSRICLDRVLSAPFAAGAKEFLERNKNKYQFFIASGTPEAELHKIVSLRGIKGHFEEIYGSPKAKRDIILDIMNKYKFTRAEVVSIGDAESDYIAAEEAGITFIERNANDNFAKNVKNFCVIKNLLELEDILKEIANTKSPLVSVIISTRNRCTLLPRAMESISKQTYSNVEVILVDDASSDSTPEVARRCGRRFRSFKYIRNHEHRGAARTRNAGIEAAGGKYIAFLDDDDEWLPQKIALQAKFLDDHPDIVAVSCWYIKSLGKKIIKVKKQGNITFEDMLWENFFGSFSYAMVRPEIFKKVGFISEGLSGVDDWDLWTKVSKNYKISVIREFLAAYHCQPKSISQWTPEFIAGYIKVFERNRAFMNESCKEYHMRKLIINDSDIKNGTRKRLKYFITSLHKYNITIKKDSIFIIYGLLYLYLKNSFLKEIFVLLRDAFQKPYCTELNRLYKNIHRIGQTHA